MRQYGIETGHEYSRIECWAVSMARSPGLIITSNDAEFEKSKREEEKGEA